MYGFCIWDELAGIFVGTARNMDGFAADAKTLVGNY